MENFLWHKISEEEKNKIKEESKKILNSFSKKLSEIPESLKSDIERKNFERKDEGNNLNLNKKILFLNAPEKNKNFIIAERKKW
jgi:Asp-tRNA(Asn)/Glu-tRNA(Gln) amidotransferase C subunit